MLFEKARALGNLVFSPGIITDISFQGGLPTIEFTIIAENTSTTGLTVNSFAGTLFSNNTLIGNVSDFIPVNIPGNSRVPITVLVQLRPLGIVNDLIRVFQYKNFSQSIIVDGFANVSGLQLPVHINFTAGNPANGPL